MENIILSVAGMHTATCAEKIQKTLSSTKGINSVSVNFSTENAAVAYDELVIDEKKIFRIIEKLGYKCQKHLEENEEQKKRKLLTRRLLSRLIFTALLSVLIIAAPYVTQNIQVIPSVFQNILILLLITLLIYIGIFSILKNTYEKTTNFKFTPDLLPSIGLFVLYGYTFVLTVAPGLSTNINRGFLYQSLAGIILVLSFTKWLEQKFEEKLHKNYENLLNLQPKKAIVIRHNEDMEVDIGLVKIGDLIKVRPGEPFPVDGIIVEGETKINETILTGAEGFINKKSGDEVVSATINIQDTVIFKATQIGKETTLSQVISLLEETKKHKGKYEKISPRIQIVFAVISFILAFGALAYWYFIYPEAWVFTGIIAFASVLFISYPSGFVFSVITPLTIGLEKSALGGIIYKGSATVEKTAKITRIVIDKTGILTNGIPELTNIITKEGFNEKRFLIMIGSLENAATHPFAEAITEYCKSNDVAFKKAYDYKIIEGMGIIGTVDGQEVIAGNMKLMEKSNVQMNKELLHKAEILSKNVRSPVYIARNRELVGVIGIADTIRESAKIAVFDLNKNNLNITMVTGDNEKIAQNIADELRIKEVRADIQQKEKIEVIQDLQEKEVVAFVGDGINDGPVLAQADIGIAIGTGTDTALSASDITCLSDDLKKINQAYTYAKTIKSSITKNLGLTFLYNLIALPTAFGAFFPLIHLIPHPALAPVLSSAAYAALMWRSIKKV